MHLTENDEDDSIADADAELTAHEALRTLAPNNANHYADSSTPNGHRGVSASLYAPSPPRSAGLPSSPRPGVSFQS